MSILCFSHQAVSSVGQGMFVFLFPCAQISANWCSINSGQASGQILWPQTRKAQHFNVNLVLRLPHPESWCVTRKPQSSRFGVEKEPCVMGFAPFFCPREGMIHQVGGFQQVMRSPPCPPGQPSASLRERLRNPALSSAPSSARF